MENKEQAAPENGTQTVKKHRRSNNRRDWTFFSAFAILAAFCAAGYWWLFHYGRVTTDDAYVMADSARIGGRVSGTVLKVWVDNDHYVKAGDTLVELDPMDYQVAMDRASAVVERLEADVKASEAGIALVDSQTRSQIEGAESFLTETKDQAEAKAHQLEELRKKRLSAQQDLKYAQQEFERYQKLYNQGSVPQQAFDKVTTDLTRAEANLNALDSEINALNATLNAARQQPHQARAKLQFAQSDRAKVEIQRLGLLSAKAQLDEARAELEQANLNLSYCTIKAPISGYIAQRNIQVGDRLQAGQPIMAVVPLDQAYVEANFKETQLEHVQIGQPAIIEADIYPNVTFRGKVCGIRAGTGASFSLLPPQNATGNWVKIVQRIPVRVELDDPPSPQYALRVGLSLTVTIDVRDSKGK
jgi:membrane fusion protein (multidrug efflux system)